MLQKIKVGTSELSWLKQAISDCNSSLPLYTGGHFSQSLFVLEQGFEKMLKFTGLMHGTIDIKAARKMSHKGVDNIVAGLLSVKWNWISHDPVQYENEMKEWVQAREVEIKEIINQFDQPKVLYDLFSKIINKIKYGYRKTPFSIEERSSDDKLTSAAVSLYERLGKKKSDEEIFQLLEGYKKKRNEFELNSFRIMNLFTVNCFCFLILSHEFPKLRYPNDKTNLSPSEHYTKENYAVQLFPIMHQTLSEYLVYQERFLY